MNNIWLTFVTHNNKTKIANVIWRQQQEKYQAQVYSALAGNIAIIQGDDTYFTITTSKETIHNKNLHNFPLPIANLKYWLNKSPNPKNPYSILAQQPFTIMQNNWRIKYINNNIYMDNKEQNIKIKIILKSN